MSISKYGWHSVPCFCPKKGHVTYDVLFQLSFWPTHYHRRSFIMGRRGWFCSLQSAWADSGFEKLSMQNKCAMFFSQNVFFSRQTPSSDSRRRDVYTVARAISETHCGDMGSVMGKMPSPLIHICAVCMILLSLWVTLIKVYVLPFIQGVTMYASACKSSFQ